MRLNGARAARHPPHRDSRFMRYRPLGRTGQFVSEICLGAMTFHGGSAGGMWRNIGTLDQAAATKLVARALEAGVNFIDTANVYSEGQSEVQVGQALRDLGVKREDVIIATKVRGRMGPGPNAVGLSRGHIMDQIDGRVETARTRPCGPLSDPRLRPVTPLEETLRALDDCVRRGLVRYDRLLEPRRLADHEGAWHLGHARLRALRDACRPTTRSRAATSSARSCRWSRTRARRHGVEPARRRIPLRQVHARRSAAERFPPHGFRLPSGRQGARLRHHRRDGGGRQGARLVGRACRACLAA